MYENTEYIIYTDMYNSTKTDAKMGSTKLKKFFFGSLEVPEHEKNGVYALAVAKLFCRPN